MRRAPQQVRGQQRVEAILAAAEVVMAEVGFEASTTNQIAARAGVPIGSLYQFFSNKNAIVEEMTRRQLDRLVIGMQHTLAQAQHLTVAQAVEMLVNLAPASTMGHSGFMRLCMEATPGSVLYETTAMIRQEVFKVITALIRCFAPAMSETDCGLHAQVAQVSWQALLLLYVREVDSGHTDIAERILAEIKRLFTSYFSAVLKSDVAL